MGRRFDVILLDVDGTLLDFNRSEALGIRRLLEHFGIEPLPEYLEAYHRINEGYWKAFERGEISKERLVTERFVSFFESLGKKADGREAENFYRSCLDGTAFLVDGADRLCAWLQERYALYIVTNGTSSTQYKRLALSGLDKYMKGIFVSEDAGSQKPQKAYFDYCFARIPEADPNRMLLIGDSLSSDIRGGQGTGCHTCWYNPQRKPLPDDVRPDFVIKDLAQVMDILEDDAPRCREAGGADGGNAFSGTL